MNIKLGILVQDIDYNIGLEATNMIYFLLLQREDILLYLYKCPNK